MPLYRIGLIADTHGFLRRQAKEVLRGCQQIIHAGDIDSPAVLEELQQIAPTTAVRGNMDCGAWANRLKVMERIKIGTWSLLALHNRADLPNLKEDTDIVIFGHSHRFLQEHKDGVLFLNPGSAGPRRFDLPISMAILTLDEGISVEQILLTSKL
ncbi:MAG: metallophosphatase family protein [Limnochordia bacterium]|jgi:putative phosphoesterase|nr:metallophosphatase family protein [Limnochordia bacterium]